MNTEWPRSEEEWQEALSAHLDGELPTDQQKVVDRAIKEDSHRASQYAELCALRATVQAWEVESDPEGKGELLGRLRAGSSRVVRREAAWEHKTATSRLWSRIPSFAMGSLAGVAATLLFVHAIGFRNAVPASPVASSSAVQVVDKLDVSKRQADALLREIAANQLKSEVLLHLQERDWSAADKVFKKMEIEYADTESLHDLRGSEALRALQRYRVSRLEENDHA
jgi:hypothetical protein